MRFVVDESVEIDKFKDEFIKNKESFFKTPIFVSMKNDEFNVLDGVKRLRCLMDESLNDNLSLLNPCLIDCGSKSYNDYERAKRAEIFLKFLNTPNLLLKLQKIYEYKNPLVGYLYHKNVFKNHSLDLLDNFANNDEAKIKNIVKNMLKHYKLDELKYHETLDEIRNIPMLFNMIKDKNFNYKEFKITEYDLEHINARKDNKDGWRNKLCNMLLLDLSTNRAYSNADFNAKAKFIQDEIKKHNKYYLYATRTVFVDKIYGDR